MAQPKSSRQKKYQRKIQERPHRQASLKDTLSWVTTSCPFLDLPEEINYQILKYLDLRDLQNVCRTYPEIAQNDSIIETIHERECERDFRLLDRRWPYHQLLVWILNDTYSPKTMEVLKVGKNWKRQEVRKTPGNRRMEKQNRERKAMFANEFRASSWFDEKDERRFISDLLAGNGDAAVALVLLRLRNLRFFSPPVDGRWTEALVHKVSIAQALAPSTTSALVQNLPLGRLVLLRLAIASDELLISNLDEDPELTIIERTWMARMLGLRTPKRINILDLDRSTFTGWPEDAVKPTCPEILIETLESPEHTAMFAKGWGFCLDICLMGEKMVERRIAGLGYPVYEARSEISLSDTPLSTMQAFNLRVEDLSSEYKRLRAGGILK